MSRPGGDLICYHCDSIFPRDEDAPLLCPHCGSDFVEIIQGSADEPSIPPSPPSLPPLSPRPPRSPQSPLHDTRNAIFGHNPWQDIDDQETQEYGGGHRLSRRSYRSPDGRITFTSTTFTSGMPGRRRSMGSPEPLGGADPLLQTVGAFFQELSGAYTRDRDVPPPDREDPWETPGAPRGAFLRRDLTPTTLHLASLNDIFDLIRLEVGDGVRIMGTTGGDAGHPFSLLAGMLGGRMGDAVYSQEELDRVISQLIDQNTNQGAPPAPETAIQSLPKKIVDTAMLGPEGKAECSICMDGVELGMEVTELPCKHWFHGNCIELWLKQHNTCPHCRRGINEGNDVPGSRNNPLIIPSSPPQSLGRHSSHDHSGSAYDAQRHQSISSSSTRSGRGSISRVTSSAPPESERNRLSQGESQSQPQSHGGGVGGWLRSRFGSS